MGIPSQIDDDPLLELVLPPPHGEAFAYAEERRLFYVALTRARHGTYLITHPTFPSAFVLELLEAAPQICDRSANSRRSAAVSALLQRPPSALREPQDAALHQLSTLHPPSATLQQLLETAT